MAVVEICCGLRDHYSRYQFTQGDSQRTEVDTEIKEGWNVQDEEIRLQLKSFKYLHEKKVSGEGW